MIPVTKAATKSHQVINRDGNGFQDTASMAVKLMTGLSYVGDLSDSDGKYIARDRRFFFADAIHDKLSKGEEGMVKGEKPNTDWSVPEIKRYLGSKGIAYEPPMSKEALLALLEPNLEVSYGE